MSVANAIPRKRFTREEVDQMDHAGLFLGERLELIDGDLIDKMGQNPTHAWVIRMLQDLLIALFGSGRVQVQCPIEVQTAERKWSLPEPDIAVLKENKPDFQTRFPTGTELLLLVEVADSSIHFDLATKRDLYARAGISEYWVVDLKKRSVIVHRDPGGGKYASVGVFDERDTVTINGASLAVAKILPAPLSEASPNP